MKKRVKKSITLKDIALQTGYSVNTVSRALRGKDDIAEETIQKIKDVASELGYVNNTIASALRLGYTNTLAVILGDISNPHFAIMTKEIENYARSKGYLAFLMNTNENKAVELEAIKTAIHKNVDGIIICPTQIDDENIRYLKKSNIPFIQIGRRDDKSDSSYVVCDDIMGGYLATKYLLDNGHRKILFLNGPDYISSARERYQGYCKAYAELGLEPDPGLVKEVALSVDNTEQVMECVFDEKTEFSSIFAFSDSVAWRAWSWLDEHGYRVPEDYSLVGFDHIQSRMPIPIPMATISSYKTQMSITAVDCILKMIQNEGTEDTENIYQKIIRTKLVRGRTVKSI
ncbi:MAG: LacI family DNA-binding transcriptional regulator [Lachnospiraceae bacterium]|nr:LacI family DNA-binding transcriptional regulator [Lachnospiraceae bacterium]